MIKVTGNENAKKRFSTYLREKWIFLRQSKAKMIPDRYTYHRIHFNDFTSRNASFIRYLSVSSLSIGTW